MEDSHIIHVLDPAFPFQDLAAIKEILEAADFCIPGFVAPEVGLFDARAMFYAQGEGVQTILLADRNVASRMAQIAEGRSADGDLQLRRSAALLGFCQCFGVEIEPGVSFHELAHKQSDSEAQVELRYFRAAENLHPQMVLDMALMRRSSIEGVVPAGAEILPGLLSKPLRRWNRNYVIALEMLDRVSRPIAPVDAAVGIIDWMTEDFMFGGPAALLASIFLAPNGPSKKELFKDLYSPDRELAIAGARNAAWDLTYLSDFIEKVNGEYPGERKNYIFSSFDKNLKTLAKLIFDCSADRFDVDRLATQLSAWWPTKDAKTLAHSLRANLDRVQAPDWARKVPLTFERVSGLIETGEEKIRKRVR